MNQQLTFLYSCLSLLLSFHVKGNAQANKLRAITDLPDQNVYVDQLTDFSNRTFRVNYRNSLGNKQVSKLSKQLASRRMDQFLSKINYYEDPF